jgi:hypothetical protein
MVTPDTVWKLPVVKVDVVPVVVVPVKEVKVPVVNLAVTPVVVVPVREVNEPVVTNTVVPVIVVPLIVPVTVNPEEIVAFPSVAVLPENVKLPEKVWFTADKF